MLKGIPNTAHLSRMYYELSKIGAQCVGSKKSWLYRPRGIEELVCLAADMSRYDPRLVTILARFFAVHWSKFNPTKVRSYYRLMDTAQTLSVISEFVLKHASPEAEAKYFFEYLQAGLKPVPLQFYFHHLYLPGSTLADRAVQTPLAEYKRWGFLATESPIFDEKGRTQAGTFDVSSRRNVLNRLLSSSKEIRLSDYRAACGGRISRQQALLDLKKSNRVKMKGRRKGARWIVLAEKRGAA